VDERGERFEPSSRAQVRGRLLGHGEAATDMVAARTAQQHVLATTLAVAGLLHLWGNPWALGGTVTFQTGARQLASIAMAIACIAALAAGRRLRVLDVVALFTLAKTVLDLPFVPSHQLLLALLASCWLVARLVARRTHRDEVSVAFAAIRATFLVAYGFAAFAKLNTAFVDPATSCVTFLARSFGASWLDRPEALEGMVPIGIGLTIVVELGVVVLLLVPRTRAVGVLVAVVFHSGLAVDPPMHVTDFAAVVLVGAVAWTSAEGRLLALERLRAARSVRIAHPPIVVLAVVVTATAVAGFHDVFVLWLASMVLLVATGVLVGGAALTDLRRREGQQVAVRTRGWTRVVVAIPVLLAALNGSAPYLEVKNDAAWNMYSNLRTTGGESNHLVVRRSLPLSTTLTEVVPDPSEGASLVPVALLHQRLLLSPDPAASVTVETGAGPRTISRSDAEEAVGPLGLRLRQLRPLAPTSAQECLRSTIR
jgi:hypothetical protein